MKKVFLRYSPDRLNLWEFHGVIDAYFHNPLWSTSPTSCIIPEDASEIIFIHKDGTCKVLLKNGSYTRTNPISEGDIVIQETNDMFRWSQIRRRLSSRNM